MEAEPFIPRREASGLTASVTNPAGFSDDYDRLRFIRPVFIGDTIHTRVTIHAEDDDPKRAVVEPTEVVNQKGEVVLAADHIHIVERRPPDGTRRNPTCHSPSHRSACW